MKITHGLGAFNETSIFIGGLGKNASLVGVDTCGEHQKDVGEYHPDRYIGGKLSNDTPLVVTVPPIESFSTAGDSVH
jgi:hypothetical protein